MIVDVITAFPGMFTGFVGESMMARAIERDLIAIRVHDLRDFTDDPHRVIDDTPFGGGGGMILKPEPIARAIDSINAQANGSAPTTCVIPTPRGSQFRQSDAEELARQKHLVFVCGHYTGVDERVFDLYEPKRFSIGDYVLSGGELPSMVIIEATARRIPGFLGNDESATGDSFVRSGGGLGVPQYTRPSNWRGREVPEILLSGHHAEVARWRSEQARRTTEQYRPDRLADSQTK